MVVVKLSLINGEHPEMDNAQEGYKFQYIETIIYNYLQRLSMRGLVEAI